VSELNPPASPLAPAISPLAEADPNSVNALIADCIDEIFNKNPLALTDADLQVQIDYYRRERQRFLVESEAKIAEGPKKRRPVPKSVAQALTPAEDDLL